MVKGSTLQLRFLRAYATTHSFSSTATLHVEYTSTPPVLLRQSRTSKAARISSFCGDRVGGGRVGRERGRERVLPSKTHNHDGGERKARGKGALKHKVARVSVTSNLSYAL